MSNKKKKVETKKESEESEAKGRFNFSLKPSNMDKLRKLAKEQGRKMSNIIDRMIEAA